MQKRLSFTLWIILLSLNSFANSNFTFWDSKEKINYIIDLKSRKVVLKKINGDVYKTSSLTLVNIDTTALVERFQINAFKYKNDFILSLQGTGQVYEFSPKLSRIERIDKTHFAGYNFLSIRFFRNDSLYSFGGTGFWQTNNILTFFNRQKGEWEALTHPEYEPIRFKNQISGYFDYYDKVYVLELPKLYTQDKTYKPYYWSFDLKSKVWTKLGILNKELENTQQDIFITGRFCFFKHYTKNLWADPGNNKLYYYMGNKSSFFSDPVHIFSKGEWIYSYYKKTGNNNQFGLDSIKTKDLFMHSNVLGKLYNKEFPFNYLIISIIIISGITIFVIYKQSKSNTSTDIEPNFKSQLNQLINLSEISALELNKILNCENKPSEAQRQIRARFISQFNNHFLAKHKIENAIVRSQSSEDKRFVIYLISKDVKDILQKTQN